MTQVKRARPTLDYDGRYGATTGVWTTDMFVRNGPSHETTRRVRAATGCSTARERQSISG